MNKAITIIITAAIVIGIGFAIREVSLNVQANNSASAFRESFMEGCEDGTNTALCACTYDALLDEYGNRGIMEIDHSAELSKELESEVFAMAYQCYLEQ